jgi:RNA polymerase sigma-70 factor (ECF subfamily)
MLESAPDDTSETLLGRLRDQPADAAAWQAFVKRYHPRIHEYCRSCNLQPADVDDVTQTVLLKLSVTMRTFHYDPNQSFRAWLKTVTRHVLSDYLAEKHRDQGSGDSDVLRLLSNVEAREGLAKQIDEEFDCELLDIALRRIRRRVPEQQWEAFQLTALERLSGADVAARLGMRVATVYTAKSKVQKLVRDEICRLDNSATAQPE